MKLTIAFLQLLPTGSLNGNMEKGITAFRQAKEKGADIAIFPEMWSCGYAFPNDEASLRECAISCDSAFVKRFSDLAAELDMAIAITMLERHMPRPRNTVCLFDRHGRLQYRYSKVHTCNFGLPDDEGVLDAGDNFFVADLDTKDGIIKVGSMICYDREFPESARILMLKGAELLLVPNACPMELNRLAQLRGRTYENMLAIATCNYPAPHPDCNGHSTLFDGVVYLPELPGSRDTCIFEADEDEGVYMAELDVDMLRNYRRREVWGTKNRRPELYGIIHSHLKVRTMHEIKNDGFYDLTKQYDSDPEYHFVGEVDYHILEDDELYEGLQSHRKALIVVFDQLVQNSIEDLKEIRERHGDDMADHLFPLVYDIDKAQPTSLDPEEFFYCPNIVKIDHNGCVFYDAEWEPNDDNFGTTVPYWYALMEPIHSRRNKQEDFKKVNEVLFPNGTDVLEIYEWSTDWSDFFNAGHEWYGACCWSVYDKSMNRYIVMLVSATD